jgi:hypothetical protein
MGTVRELYRLFHDADKMAAARLSSQSQPNSAYGGAAETAALLLDDDLDLQSKVAASSGRCDSKGWSLKLCHSSGVYSVSVFIFLCEPEK